MKFIECKVQHLSRPVKTRTSISGFEGPSAKTELDDGFGVPTMKGMLTPSYSCWYEQTGMEDNSPTYDGTINVPDTKANRYKIAQSVRAKDLRVKDRNMETQILGEHPFVSRAAAPRQYSLIAEMPEDFDGSKVVLRSGTHAIVDMDPINDPHAQVQEGEFTEVKTSTSPEKEPVDEAVKLAAPVVAVSVAAARQGGLPPQATSAPKGFDPKAVQERAKAVKAEAAAAKTEDSEVKE
jgi:hypothetical protein